MKRVVLIFIAILAMAAAINADVTIKRQVTFEMAGMPPNEMMVRPVAPRGTFGMGAAP